MPLIKEYVIAAAAEATLGTAETLDAADGAMLAYDLELPDHIVDVQERTVHGTMSKLTSVKGTRQENFKFKTFMHGKGSIGVPTWASVLLPAIGMYDDSNTFKLKTGVPVASAGEPRTLTIGAYIDGVRMLGAGCMGKVKFIFENGKQPFCEWEMMGKFSAFADVAIIAPTLPSVAAIRAANLTLDWDGYTLVTNRVEIDLQNEVVVRQDMSSGGGDAGLLYATIIDRDPVIKCQIEMPLVATKDLIAALHNGSTGAFNLNLAQGGTSSWNNIEFDAPAAAVRELKLAERDGILAGDITFELTRSAANDDEFTFAFTAGT